VLGIPSPEALLASLSSRYSNPVKVGAGGMGVVYKVYDTQLQREVAVKMALLSGGGDLDELRKRFLREARALARLSHPNVVPVFDVVAGPLPFYTMPFLHGESLDTRRSSKMPLPEKYRVALEVTSALEHAHSRGCSTAT